MLAAVQRSDSTFPSRSGLSGVRIVRMTDLIKSASSDEEALMGGVAVAFWAPPRVAA
jgi:hypothetical protein